MRRADSRAACTAGRSSATSTPMMAMTTSSSTSVKAQRQRWRMEKRMVGSLSTTYEEGWRRGSQAESGASDVESEKGRESLADSAHWDGSLSLPKTPDPVQCHHPDEGTVRGYG